MICLTRSKSCPSFLELHVKTPSEHHQRSIRSFTRRRNVSSGKSEDGPTPSLAPDHADSDSPFGAGEGAATDLPQAVRGCTPFARAPLGHGRHRTSPRLRRTIVERERIQIRRWPWLAVGDVVEIQVPEVPELHVQRDSRATSVGDVAIRQDLLLAGSTLLRRWLLIDSE